MIFDSMAACQAEGVSMCDAHPDMEVFRLRLGKALNYEFHEDSQTGLFQRRDPREGDDFAFLLPCPKSNAQNSSGGAALDIERGNNSMLFWGKWN